MDQRKTDLLEAQLLIEQLEQREQMLEAQTEMLQVQEIYILLCSRTSLQNILLADFEHAKLYVFL